jgi:glutathione reductase (NADPH)
MTKKDLIVLGAGPSGGRVAAMCADKGLDVALIESREFGGTCALRGCNPKKVLVHAAEAVDAAQNAARNLNHADEISIDWESLIEQKESFVQDIPENALEKFKGKGIECVLGQPTFISDNTILVGDREFAAEKIVIATGARPRTLEFPGHEHVTLSDQFMNLKSLPKRILFIGGGYISLEFAHVAIRAGSEVTVIDRNERPLKGFEPEIVDALLEKTEQIGIDFRVNATVQKICSSDDGTLAVTLDADNAIETKTFDLVVHGAGRVPNLDAMDLDKGLIDFCKNKGVLVDAAGRSKSNKRVFAVGDCAATSNPMLTPTANEQGRQLGKALLGEESEDVDQHRTIAKVVFTVPQVAAVGKTKAQARADGDDFEVKSEDWSQWGSVKKVNQTAAHFTILVDNHTNKILGAHLIGPAAGELINIFTMAIEFGITASQIKSVLMGYPTFSSDIRMMV